MVAVLARQRTGRRAEDLELSRTTEESLWAGIAALPGSIMPSYDGSTYFVDGKPIKGGVLTDDEIDDVAAYLRSLRLPEEADYWRGIPVHGTNTTAGGSQ